MNNLDSIIASITPDVLARFESQNVDDTNINNLSVGDIKINVQNVNGYKVFGNNEDGYVAYNSDGKLVYKIDKDGIGAFKTKNGDDIYIWDVAVNDIKPGIIADGAGEYTFSGDVITKAITADEYYGGSEAEIVYNDDSYYVKSYIDDNYGRDLIGEYIYDNDGTSISKDYINKKNTYSHYSSTDGKYTYYYTKYDDGYISYYDEDGYLCRAKDVDGSIIYFNKSGMRYNRVENEDGTFDAEYFDENEKIYCIEHADGSKEYLTGDSSLILYPDGTYVHGTEKGTYELDWSNNICCYSAGESITYFDKYGTKYEKVELDEDDSRGTKYYYSKDSMLLNNDEKKYAKINHIEYDEELYKNVLNTLNGIDGSSVINNCESVTTSISGFPDKWYSSKISTIESDFNSHINLVKSLSEMTNYSLLAYQTCDEDLRKGLYLLIDSIFGDNKLGLADRFKHDIEGLIEDKDGDQILEYKTGVNFKALSENAIVSQVITDEDGNKWYINKTNHVIGLDGKDFKINYGGETFNLSYDENGIIKLTDSKGEPLNIFGDYNLESEQYGGDQGDLPNALNDKYVNDIIDKYFPDISYEQKMGLLSEARNTGCGNVAVTNLVFKKFEGNEDGFYNTFGYSMYDIKYDANSGMSVDYNYEPLIMDLYCHENPHLGWPGGTDEKNVDSMVAYLKDEYDVSLTDYSKSLIFYGGSGYDLYETNGEMFFSNGGGHAMIITEETEDGKQIVSTWGKKLIFDPNRESLLARYGRIHCGEIYIEYK